MRAYIRYPLVLAIVAALSGSALYATFTGTKSAAEKQEELARVSALKSIFIDGFGATEEVRTEDGKLLHTKVWKGEEKDGPADYYAVEGSAVGYNSSVPIRLLAGFANPGAGEYEKMVLVGWSVTRSEETPGLGEKIKEEAPAYTWAELITGKAGKPAKDRRTEFQKQFADADSGNLYTAEEIALAKDGGEIDAISGATITSRAIVNAIKDAEDKLTRAMQE